jgi:hypothetical protein
MPIHQTMPECPKKWVNNDELESTIELTVGKGGPNVDRDEIRNIMIRKGIKPEEFLACYQLERWDVWYVVVDGFELAEAWVMLHPTVKVVEGQDRIITCSLYNCVDTEVRYMWVPSCIKLDYVKWVMNQWGELKDIYMIHNYRNQTTYVATLGMTLKQRDQLPHTTDIPGYPRNQLVTMKGRQQLCLYCKELGHMRYFCPKKEADIQRRYSAPPRDYASAAANNVIEQVVDKRVATKLPDDKDDDDTGSVGTNASRDLEERETEEMEATTVPETAPSQPEDQELRPRNLAAYSAGSAPVATQSLYDIGAFSSGTQLSTPLDRLIQGTPLSPTHSAPTAGQKQQQPAAIPKQSDPRLQQSTALEPRTEKEINERKQQQQQQRKEHTEMLRQQQLQQQRQQQRQEQQADQDKLVMKAPVAVKQGSTKHNQQQKHQQQGSSRTSRSSTQAADGKRDRSQDSLRTEETPKKKNVVKVANTVHSRQKQMTDDIMEYSSQNLD